MNIILVKKQTVTSNKGDSLRWPYPRNPTRNLQPATTFLSYHGEVNKIARLKAVPLQLSAHPDTDRRRRFAPIIQQEGRHQWSLASTWRRNPALM